MRILVLCHEFPPIGGGAAAVAEALSKEYITVGNSVVVITMGFKGLPQRESREGVEIYRLDCSRRKREMASVGEALFWARKAWVVAKSLHNKKAFDITHVHFVMPAGIVAQKLKIKAGVPFIITLHGSDVPGYNRERFKIAHFIARPWWKKICKSADQIVSPSESLLKLFAQRASGIGVQVIPNGFWQEKFRPLAKEKRILLCSRLVERKGVHYFLEALQEINLEGWQVDIVGDGPQFHRLSEMAALGRTKVNMHGWIDNNDPKLAELYGRAMIFVFPSEWENLSMVLLEAMGAGCSIIASDVAGNPEVLGDTGCLVPPTDIYALKKAVIELAHNEELCKKLGQKAAQRAVDMYTWPKIAFSYLELLKGLHEKIC